MRKPKPQRFEFAYRGFRPMLLKFYFLSLNVKLVAPFIIVAILKSDNLILDKKVL